MAASQELRFSAQFWPKGTSVRMINVPWDAAYKDIVQFAGEGERDNWLDAQVAANMSTTNMTYVGPGQDIVLPCPVTTAEGYNYLYVSNPSYFISDGIDSMAAYPRRYCYFITDATWLSPAACRVTLQLDVWTTWAPYVRFTRAFVTQGHAAIANRNLWDGTSLSDITPIKMQRYLSAPEDVDAGGEYYQIYTDWTDLTVPSGPNQVTYVGVMSSVDLSQPWGTVNNPNILSASGSIQEGMLAGVQVIYFKTSDFIALLDDLKNAPWVSRNIMQVWLAPGRLTQLQSVGTIHGHTYYRPTTGTPADYLLKQLNVSTYLANHYLANMTVAPKLMTAPYSFIELNAFEGSPLVLKPQRTGSLTEMVIYGKAVMMAPWDRIAIYPLYYGAGGLAGDVSYNRMDILGQAHTSYLHKGDNLDSALWISDLPRFAFTSDGYLSWLANSAHSRAWSYQNNDWNYHKGSLSAQLGYQQATESRDLAYQQDVARRDQADAQRLIRTLTSVAGGVSIMDPLEMIGNTAQSVGNLFMDQAVADLARSQAADTNALANKQTDENFALAQRAMRGDYQQAIASLSATQKDAEITPPSVVGSAGGNGWNYAMGMLGFRTTIKVPSSGQEQVLIGYFKRFGYRINELMDMPTNLKLMSKFTYWKLQESFLFGNVTESAKQAIRGIFEKGVTVWGVPEDITIFSYSTSTNGIDSSNPFSY